jgi:hypothetical protein
MSKDNQLRGVTLEDVLEKRRLGQALNAKEFAVLAGISYSTARQWFRLPGFPVFEGVVFWQDFVDWRRSQTGLNCAAGSLPENREREKVTELQLNAAKMPLRAVQILREATQS